ncbi:MAG: hypothetical protein BWY51_00554 [Parcubacteria group bacterium ADurb.Bin316]|nr:MAG: hypothetical protein BWY51_00554 [Parcubacteria group bacterium ADurb.Bin316]HOZ56457.1 hypothetical protein [bacterium]
MSKMQKVIISVLSTVFLGVSGYFAWDYFSDSRQNRAGADPESIVANYKKLMEESEQLKVFVGDNCDNKKAINQQIKAMEKQLADLASRKEQWLSDAPPLPDVEPELISTEETSNRPGSEVPELTPDVPPLPDFEPELLETEGRPGSEVPELTPDVPPLPDVNIEVTDDSGPLDDYIPDMPEINTGRPGYEVPELTPDVPPLPDVEMDIIDPNEYIFQMENYEQKIKNILQELAALCQEDEEEPMQKKIISDKCSDACQRHKDCSAFTDDVTSADLNDAYNTCIEECATWTKEMIKCINAIDIKAPNDCVGFLQCQLPQFYEEKYLN